MKLRVLSIGRRIAIAVCAVLALVTGTLSVAYPHFAGTTVQAATYEKLAVTTSLTQIETGLDGLNGTNKQAVLDQLKKYLTVTADGATVPSDDYTVDSVSYEGSGAKITVSAAGVSGRVTAEVAVDSAVAPVLQSVSVSVDPEKAERNEDGIYKVLQYGRPTDESVFLTDTGKRPVQFTDGKQSILDFLKIELRYQNVTLPISKVEYNEEGELSPQQIGQVYSYRINQKSFTAGSRTITVSVEYDENGNRLNGSLDALFEDVQIISLEATQKGGVLYSYSDVISSVTVTAKYNDGTSRVLSEREYTTNSSLIPTEVPPATQTSDFTTSNSGADRDSNVPDNTSSYNYSKDITITSGGISTTLNISGITLANPHQIIGIVGVPALQKEGAPLDLSGLSVAISYVVLYHDKTSKVYDGWGGTTDLISGTIIDESATIMVPLTDLIDSLTVKYNGGAAQAAKDSVVPTISGNGTTVSAELTFTYNGQMFYFSTGAERNSSGLQYHTNWSRNPNTSTNTFELEVDKNEGPSVTANYYTRPIINEDIVTYREGLTKPVLGVDFSNPQAVANGTRVEITNLADNTKLGFTYTVSGDTVTMLGDAANQPGTVGAAYTQEGKNSRFSFTKPGRFSVAIILPEVQEGATPNYFYGTTSNRAEYEIEIEKGDLTVSYTNLTLTENGLAVAQGTLLSSLQKIGVLFSTGGNIVSGANAPQTYAVYVRRANEPVNAKRVLLRYTNGAREELTADELTALSELAAYDHPREEFYIHTETSGNDYYKPVNTGTTPVTLFVVIPNVDTITSVNVQYDRTQTAKKVIDEWTENFGGEYDVTISKDGAPLTDAAAEVLHVNNAYTITFTRKSGANMKTVPLVVSPVFYNDVKTSVSGDAEYDGELKFTDLITRLKDAVSKAYNSAHYYTLNTNSIVFTDAAGNTTSDVRDLSVGAWTAQFNTQLGANDAEGDYNLPAFSVTFNITALNLTFSVDGSSSAFTSDNGYNANYTGSELVFAITGWNAAAEKNVSVSVKGMLSDGTTEIPANFYSLTTDGEFKLSLYTAGTYTVTLTDDSNNVTLPAATSSYTLTVSKVAATLSKTETSVQISSSFALPSDVTVNGVNASEELYISNYKIYSDEGCTTEIAAADMEVDGTYYVKVTGISGDYVKSVDGRYQATFTYGVNYELPETALTLKIAQGSLPALVAKDELKDENGALKLVANYGTGVNILSYFTNATDAGNYVVTVTAAARTSFTAEDLANGTLPAGNYVVTIDANPNFAWVGGEAVSVNLTVGKAAIDIPELVVATGTYTGASNSVKVGGTSAYWGALKGIVTATVYRFDIGTTDFTIKADTVACTTATFEIVEEEGLTVGKLTYTDAGIYYIVFELTSPNYYWKGGAETQTKTDAARVAEIACKELSVPVTKRVWEQGETVNYGATGSATIDGYTVNYDITTDTTAKTVKYTVTSITKDSADDIKHNFVWARNADDYEGLAYLGDRGYGVVNGLTATLNYAVVTTKLDISYDNKASVVYGGYVGGAVLTDLNQVFVPKGSASIPSGTTVSYSYLDGEGNVNSITADSIKTLDAGTYAVTVSLTFGADTTYAPMTFYVALTVSPRPVTIILNGTLAYGGELSNTTFAYAADSLHFNDSVSPAFAYALDTYLDVQDGSYAYSDYAWAKLDNTLANYEVTFDDASALTVVRGTANVSLNLEYFYGETPAGGTLNAVTDAAKFVYDKENVGASGTVSYTVTKNGEDYDVTLNVSTLSSKNYNFVAKNSDCKVTFNKLAVNVKIGNATANFGTRADLDAVDVTIEVATQGVTVDVAALTTELKTYLTLSTDAFVGANGTAQVGKYPITAAIKDNDHFEVAGYTNGEYTVAFDTAWLNVTAEENLKYTGSSLNLIKSVAIAQVNGADPVAEGGYTVYYSTDTTTEKHWSTAARETNANTYTVSYYIDIAGYGKVEINNTLSVVIAKGENTIKTDFNVNNAVADSAENIGETDAWKYGKYDVALLTVPEADFGGTVTYTLYKGDATEAFATGTDLTTLLQLHANRMECAVYKLVVSTSDAGNYESASKAYFFKVGKAALTFKAADTNVTYGDAAKFDYVVTGLNTAAGDTKESVLGNDFEVNYNCDYKAGDADNGNVREDGYAITLSVSRKDGGDFESLANYTVETADGTLTVTARPITIKINSETVDYRTNNIPRPSALLVRGTLPDGVELEDVITLVTPRLNFENLSAANEWLQPVGTYYIYPQAKGTAAVNYVVDFFDCEYNAENNHADYIEGGKYFGMYTINTLFVNTTWNGASQAFVYNGRAISLEAYATSYSQSDGSVGEFPSPRKLSLSYIAYTKDLDINNSIAHATAGLPTNAGSYVIYAAMADTNYTTGGAYIIIVIEKATLELQVDNLTMTYGDNLPAGKYSLKDTNQLYTQADKDELDGKTTSYSVLNGGTVVLAEDANKLGAGTYALTLAEIALTNYKVLVSYGSLTINRRQVTVTLNNFERPYKGAAYDQSSLGLDAVDEDGNSTAYTVTNMPSNGDKTNATTLGITLAVVGTARNVGTYGVVASAVNDGNYIVTFMNNTAQFKITPAEIYVQTTLSVLYGEETPSSISYEIGTLDSKGNFVAGIGEETYQYLLEQQALTTNVVYVGGAPEYTLTWTKKTTPGQEYTINRVGTAGFSFMNYTVAENGYLTKYVIEKRVVTVTGAVETEYTGSAINPKFTYGNLAGSESLSVQLNYLDAAGDSITYIIDAGTYTVVLSNISGNESKHYIFEGGKDSLEIEFTVLKKLIDVEWENDSMRYDSSATGNENYNRLIGYSDAVNGLVDSVLTRTYTVYSTSTDGTVQKGESKTDTLAFSIVSSDNYGRMLVGIGKYKLTLTLKEGNSANYQFKDGETQIIIEFSAYSNTVEMNVAVSNKVYDGKAPVETVSVEGTVFEGDDLANYLTKSYAKINAETADILNAIGRKLNSADMTQNGVVFNMTVAPSDAGYYVFHVVYFRDLPTGAEGADVYVVYQITPWVIETAPVIGDTTSAVYDDTVKEFTITISDPAAIDAFLKNPNWITVTGIARDYSDGSVPEVAVTDAIVWELNETGTVLTVTAKYTGNYTVTFHLGNDNYEWKKDSEDSNPDIEGGVGDGIAVNENGDVTISFSITLHYINLETETELNQASAVYGGEYLDAVKNSLHARGVQSFVDLNNITVAYFAWRADGNYAGVPDLGANALRAGKYHYSVHIPGTTNYNTKYENGTLIVNKKDVLVTVDAFGTFGSDIVTFNRDSFRFDGFTANVNNPWDVLAVDYDALSYTIGTIGEENYSNGFLNAGKYVGILDLEAADGNLIGFNAVGTQDDYNYVFNKADSSYTVNRYEITVNIGNASSPFGSPINVRNVALTTGNNIFEPYESLRDLLGVRFSLNADSQSNAGNYVLTATANNGNYLVNFNSGVYTITPIAVAVTLNAGGGVYNGKIDAANLARVSSSESPDLTRRDIEGYIVFRYTGTSFSGVDYDGYTVPTLAGSYTVTAEIDPEKTGNFTLIGNASAVFAVERMSLDVTKLSAENIVYNGNAHRVTIIDNDYNVGGAQLYEYNRNQTFTQAGIYYLTLTVRDAANMQWSTRESEYALQVVISKGTNGVSNITIENWTYGEAANKPKAELSHNDGAQIVFEYYVDGAWTTVVPTNAGSYSVRASVAESANYNAYTSLEQRFEIYKKTLTVPSLEIITEGENRNDMFTGSTLLANVLGYDAETMLLSYSDASSVSGNNVTLSAFNAGTYRITIKLNDAVNYAWARSDDDDDGVVTLLWTVTPRKIETNPTANTDKFIVDGSILEYLPEGFDSSIMDIENNQIGHSGKFTVTVKLKDTANYTWADGSTDSLTFEWTVEGVSNIFIGIVGGLAGVVVIAAVALFAQIGVHNKKKKREAAEMENRDGTNAEEGV